MPLVTNNLNQAFSSRSSNFPVLAQDQRLAALAVERPNAFPLRGRGRAMYKIADDPFAEYGPSYMSAGGGGASNMETLAPQIRNPFLEPINFYLPQTRIQLNHFIRYYDRFDPLFRVIHNMHGYFPISDFELVISDETNTKAKYLYQDMAEDSDLFGTLLAMSREYDLMGEVIPFAVWDNDKGYYTRFQILNPDCVEMSAIDFIYRGKEVMYFKAPEFEEMTGLEGVFSSEDMFAMENVYDAGVGLKMKALSDENVTMLAKRLSPYDLRGLPDGVCVLKELMYKDQLKGTQWNIAHRMGVPSEIWILGDENWVPTEEYIDGIRSIAARGAYSQPVQVFSPYNIDVKHPSGIHDILPLAPEFEYVDKSIIVGLMGSSAVVAGESATFAGHLADIELILERYVKKRQVFENWMKRKLFRKVAEVNDLRIHSKADRDNAVRTSRGNLILPTIKWKKDLALAADDLKRSAVNNMMSDGKISLETWCEVFGEDYEREKERLEKEGKLNKVVKV